MRLPFVGFLALLLTIPALAFSALDSPELAKFRETMRGRLPKLAGSWASEAALSYLEDVEVPRSLLESFFAHSADPGQEDPDADAFRQLRRSAKNGSMADQLMLGKLLDSPSDFVQEFMKNFPDAAEHYRAEGTECLRQAAGSGSLEAAFRLGLHYQLGVGTGQNIPTAGQYYAKSKDTRGKLLVGLMLLAGDHTKERLHAARSMLDQSASDSRPLVGSLASYFIGIMTFTGKSLPHDDSLALEWLARASKGGLAEAEETLKTLRSMGLKEEAHHKTLLPAESPR